MPREKTLKTPRLIVFFGADGSGKTTNARLLGLHLEKQGFKVRFVWIRAHHTLAGIFSTILSSFGYYRIISAPGKNYKLFDVRLLPSLSVFWGFIEFISVLPWILIKVKLPLLFGYVVIADRYVVDTIVSIAYSLGSYGFMSGYAAKILLTMISNDAFLIHLDADVETILERRKDEKIDVNFIHFQRKAYLYFAKSLEALSINTSIKNTADAFEVILKDINSP